MVAQRSRAGHKSNHDLIWFDLIWFDDESLASWFDLIWFDDENFGGWFDLIWFDGVTENRQITSNQLSAHTTGATHHPWKSKKQLNPSLRIETSPINRSLREKTENANILCMWCIYIAEKSILKFQIMLQENCDPKCCGSFDLIWIAKSNHDLIWFDLIWRRKFGQLIWFDLVIWFGCVFRPPVIWFDLTPPIWFLPGPAKHAFGCDN